jgi:hypothetical protein
VKIKIIVAAISPGRSVFAFLVTSNSPAVKVVSTLFTKTSMGAKSYASPRAARAAARVSRAARFQGGGAPLQLLTPRAVSFGVTLIAGES